MKIAVIGSGIAGLSAAWLLSSKHEVTLFEKDNRIGGHSNTIEVQEKFDNIPIDTGFIVFNKKTYPNLVCLFHHLGVLTKPSEMSFSVSIDGGTLEYAGTNINGLFGQRKNIFNSKFWQMLFGVFDFYRNAPSLIQNHNDPLVSLGQFLDEERFNKEFVRNHLIPMGSAIWSAAGGDLKKYPASAFVDFFKNHGLLNLINRPQWHTVLGGSCEYVKRILSDYQGKIQFFGVDMIQRNKNDIKLRLNNGAEENFDHVVIAAHANDAYSLLSDASEAETALLSKWQYSQNQAVLHTDISVMPERKRVWASWNFMGKHQDGENQKVCVTYWMNRLQRFDSDHDYFVTLNANCEISENKVIKVIRYTHPIFDRVSLESQKKLWGIQGQRRTWYCGSYFGSGFHEDGLQSGLAVAEKLGNVSRPWTLSNMNDRINFVAEKCGSVV